MKVKTLKKHQNMHGAHAVGDEYDSYFPDADLLFGYVEIVPLKQPRAKREVVAEARETFDPKTDEV